MNSATTCPARAENSGAPETLPDRHESMFRQMFERSTDAMFLCDPRRLVFVDCNQAAVEMLRASSKAELLLINPADMSPEFQPDGRRSHERTLEDTARALQQGSHRFDWWGRRMDGSELIVEVLLTPIMTGEQTLISAVCRDISDRKRSEAKILELNASLEQRVVERTLALATSEARFRALVEHAPDAIVVFDGATGRFLFGNEHACRLYGVPMERLAELTPADVSPEFQAGGRRSSELAKEKMDAALRGEMPVFEWIHQSQSDGRLIPTEVRLLHLPAEGRNLIRASIIDSTDRKNAERALRESEAKFRALFEGASQGVVLHDEKQLLEANPAAVRILGRRSALELIGRSPADFSPTLQPNGERSDVLCRQHIHDCLTQGSARFDWLACDPDGREISLEIMLTRIEWSGRQVIQAFITDITERKRAQTALAESEARFSAAFQANPVFIGITRMSDGHFVLVNDAFVTWSGYCREEILGRTTLELGLWEQPPEREVFWADLRRDGSVRERECRFRNRAGKPCTMLISAQVIQLDHAPHMLAMALDITERNRAEAELRAREAQLRESEARFSVAFHASPALIGILSLSDGKYVLANDAHLNWLGYSREELIGHTCLELGMWENPAERELLLRDVHAFGSVRQRECRWRNRGGEFFTVLVSVETIKLNDTPHILVMALDITQRKRVEEELRASEARLRESEARFSVAFEASPMFINILRMSDGKYVWANDAFVNRLGYAREEVLGRASAEFGMWADPAEREWAWKTMRTRRSIRQQEVRWLDRRGEPFTILLSAEVINFNDAPHILSLALDITQRKRAEVELLKTLEREKELSQLKSNFVSMVSHEFRTPLGIIQSSAELLRDFYQKMEPPEREDQLDSISRNACRMAGMMEEVLALSRLDAGKLIFQPAALDLNQFCRRIVDEVLSATNRQCTIELSLHSLPAEAEADERLLSHIFTNLLSNAVKYSEPGAAVHFSVERNGHDAVCVIRDHGIGISKEDQKQLFKAFHRGGNVGTRPGTGLGLLLVKRCTELHRGKVHVNSKVGEGTSVTVKLPVFCKNHEKDIGD